MKSDNSGPKSSDFARHTPPSVRPTDLLNKLEETIIAALLAAAVMVILAAVIQRYSLTGAVALMHWAKANGFETLSSAARSLVWGITSIRLTWAQELTIFLIIWMAKFGAAYGVRTGIHIGVDLIVARLSGVARTAFVLFGLLAGAFFTGVVGWLGMRFVMHLYGTGHYAAVLEVPMWVVYLAVPLGSFLMCFRFLEAAWKFYTTGELAKHEPGHLAGSDPSQRTVISIGGVNREGSDPTPRRGDSR